MYDEEKILKIVTKVKECLKELGQEENCDLLKNMKYSVTNNTITFKVMRSSLKNKEEK